MSMASSVTAADGPERHGAEESELQELLSILEEMIPFHQQLLSVLQTEKKLMIEGNLNDLLCCVQEKELLIGAVGQLEKRRQEASGRIADRLGSPDRPLGLKALIERVSEPFQERLRACHAKLQALASSIVEINQINGLLINRTLEQITSLVGLLRHLTAGTVTYQPSGLLTTLQPSGRSIARG